MVKMKDWYPLKNVELNYPKMDKQSFNVVKMDKKFIHYILQTKVFVIVPNLAIKKLLIHNELGDWRGKWMVILQEFNLEI